MIDWLIAILVVDLPGLLDDMVIEIFLRKESARERCEPWSWHVEFCWQDRIVAIHDWCLNREADRQTILHVRSSSELKLLWVYIIFLLSKFRFLIISSMWLPMVVETCPAPLPMLNDLPCLRPFVCGCVAPPTKRVVVLSMMPRCCVAHNERIDHSDGLRRTWSQIIIWIHNARVL